MREPGGRILQRQDFEAKGGLYCIGCFGSTLRTSLRTPLSTHFLFFEPQVFGNSRVEELCEIEQCSCRIRLDLRELLGIGGPSESSQTPPRFKYSPNTATSTSGYQDKGLIGLRLTTRHCYLHNSA